MTHRIRRLSDAEIDLWMEVARSVVPRPDASMPQRVSPRGAPSVLTPKPKPQPDAPQRRPTAASYTPATPAPGPTTPSGLDRKYRRKVAGGRVPIDDAIDLHGMTQAQAHGALLGFLVRAQARHARLVLVVTGKGGRERLRPDGGTEAGVLRRVVPFWLRDAGVRDMVVGFEEANRSHGGEGALYIRLRRGGR